MLYGKYTTTSKVKRNVDIPSIVNEGVPDVIKKNHDNKKSPIKWEQKKLVILGDVLVLRFYFFPFVTSCKQFSSKFYCTLSLHSDKLFKRRSTSRFDNSVQYPNQWQFISPRFRTLSSITNPTTLNRLTNSRPLAILRLNK